MYNRLRPCLGPMMLGAGVLVAATGLQAKELPRRKADAPKAADMACAYLGEGYTRAPGSDTCVKISGYVRADGAVIWGR